MLKGIKYLDLEVIDILEQLKIYQVLKMCLKEMYQLHLQRQNNKLEKLLINNILEILKHLINNF
jgi:hypothetical protein